MQRLLPPLLFILAIIEITLLDIYFPILELFGLPYLWIGLIPIFFGAWITVAASQHFKRIGTNIKTFNDPEKIVDTGWFARSRNPMYLGFVLMILGAAVLCGSLSPFIIALLFFFICDRWYIRFEEDRMQKVFGEVYTDYRRRVRRWI